MSTTPTPRHMAETLAALVDTLLPGDDLFPPASRVGTQELLSDRLREQRSAAAVVDLVERLDALCPGEVTFAQASAAVREEVVHRFEATDRDTFNLVYMAACYAYYASPLVTAAIRALGYDYREAPQPEGYALPVFDFTPGINVPLAPKGSYKPTEMITRVDLSGLEDLGLPVQDSVREEGA